MGGLSNLPPGVTESMIPGNRPEDAEWERFHDAIDDDIFMGEMTVEEARQAWFVGYHFIISNRRKKGE